ncbi:MAG TPA: acetoin dehydrogenase dihydrolipoyllysine-residue acetyltransferase subunit [Acidobacteriaceae bacterium]|nr:acetoin dehydrogenase dihydrolipoyllysine-residue acetyltransferase subunit [Acidobacteriaceae bacterium]
MSNDDMYLLTLPKWGLSMTKGQVVGWLIEEGAEVRPGQELVEIETEKVLSSVEATMSGVLRRRVARAGDVVHVGGLLGVIAASSVSDLQIDQCVADFQASYVPEKVEEEVAGPILETVDVDGFHIRYLRRGKGDESTILIHGFGGDLNTWMFNHEALASGHSVYALDLPGHGRSSKQLADGTLEGFAKVVEGFLDKLGLTKAHLGGHSLGGAVAAIFAQKHPQRCLSLTLIASAGLGPEIDGEYIRGFVSATRRNELKPQLEKLFANPRLITRQMVDDTLKYKRLDGVELALRTITAQFCPLDRQSLILREQISQLSMPVLVLWGSEDRILPASHALNLPQHVRTEILQGQGHMVHMEAASKVNTVIQSFWEFR